MNVPTFQWQTTDDRRDRTSHSPAVSHGRLVSNVKRFCNTRIGVLLLIVPHLLYLSFFPRNTRPLFRIIILPVGVKNEETPPSHEMGTTTRLFRFVAPANQSTIFFTFRSQQFTTTVPARRAPSHCCCT